MKWIVFAMALSGCRHELPSMTDDASAFRIRDLRW